MASSSPIDEVVKGTFNWDLSAIQGRHISRILDQGVFDLEF